MESQAIKDTFSNLKKKMEAARARPRGFRMLKPRTRWHVLLRRVLHLKYWLDFADLETTEIVGLTSQRRMRAHSGEMSPSEKALLRRPVAERTDEEKETLSKLFSGLKCFRRYPENVRKQLATFVSLEAYDANKVIIQQGHRAEGMYFVCSGQLEMWEAMTDPVLGEERELRAILGAGDVFGNISLLRNVPRARTVISKTIVELLLLRKHDFDTVLKATIMKEWAQIKDSLSEIRYFDDWEEIDIQDICIQSKMMSFSDGETILGDGFGVSNMSYFIAEGKAIVIQHLILVRKENNEDYPSRWGPAVKCLPLGTKIQSALGECVFMKIAEMDKGACFNLGENLKDRRIVAQGPVKTTLIPLFALTSRNRGYLWTRIRDLLNRRLPNQRELFLTMLNGRDWMSYRKEIRNSVPSRPGNHTCIHDVPLSYRAANDIPAVMYSAYTLGRLDHPKKWQWILKRKQKAVQDAVIEAAKLEFKFDEEFMKSLASKHEEQRKSLASKHEEQRETKKDTEKVKR